MAIGVTRRDFVAPLAAATVSPLLRPFAARAQRAERVRRIGVILPGAEDSPSTRTVIAALRDGLRDLGWSEGRNLEIDVRYVGPGGLGGPGGGGGGIDSHVNELLRLAVEVIVCNTLAVTRAVQQQTRTVPIVFAGVGDPVAAGLIGSLARPEGNTTGITNLYYSIAGKWLEILKEAVPRVTRVAIVFNPEFNVTEGYFAVIDNAAPLLGLTAVRMPLHGADEIGPAFESFAAEPNGGIVVIPPGLFGGERESMFAAALRHRLPAIYHAGGYASEGGLMGYGVEPADLFRGSASYVDRLLRGAKPGDLPVQLPTRFEFVVNLKTARAMGLELPPMLIARADAVIE